MEITRKTFVACSAAALAAMPAAASLATEPQKDAEADAATDISANEPDGYTFYETESGLSVTVADDEDPALPTVVVLATGGTIAGTGEAGKTTGYAAGQLDVGTLVNSAAGILEIANVRGAQVCNVGSDDITDAYWIQIANTINELADDDAIAGFVVTHGTDTLEETAYFLNLTAKTQKPVVLTGAMRPSTATSADGPMNLYQSIALAANPEAVGRGAMVVFSDGIYGGRDVQKINTFKTDAFNGRDMGCLGYMQDANAYFFNATTKAHTVDTEFDVAGLENLPPVAVAYFTIDADPGVLDYFAENGAEGIVIAGAGAGSYSGLWGQKLAALVEGGCPVVDCSRINAGLVSGEDGGMIEGYNLPPQKAVVLLRLGLTVTSDVDELQEMFKTY